VSRFASLQHIYTGRERSRPCFRSFKSQSLELETIALPIPSCYSKNTGIMLYTAIFAMLCTVTAMFFGRTARISRTACTAAEQRVLSGHSSSQSEAAGVRLEEANFHSQLQTGSKWDGHRSDNRAAKANGAWDLQIRRRSC